MIKTTIAHQRQERDRLLAHPYLVRHVGDDVDELLRSHSIKLITGPRRAGKSTQALLMLRGKNFAYLNFDDNDLLEAWNETKVEQAVDEIYPGHDFLLLDEVQNVPSWDVWVSKLYRRGVNMVITGSNANMLSGEMATMLTGRYVELKILPFSLAETFEWNHLDTHHIVEKYRDRASMLCDDYLHNGGYPETVAQRGLTHSYMSTLFDAIVFKDVVRRHRVRNVTDLSNLAHYLLSNVCNQLSYNNVKDDLGLSSVSTTKKFMHYLHEPYLFYYLARYNNKMKLMKKAPQKVYVVDNGFITSRGFNLSENLGRLLENMVFIELLRRGYDTENSIFYYRSRNDKETDFVLRDGVHVKHLIQVCYDLSSDKTRRRETESIVECAGELNCSDLTIVTYATAPCVINEKGYNVQVVPFMQWQLGGYRD